MPIYLKQSTASQEVPLGYFVDSTDGNTEKTGLTIANTDIKLWKNGATSLANKNSGGGTHISNGIYYAVMDATDTNTLGPMVAFIHVAGALAVRVEMVVLAANVYDSLIGGGDILDVSTTQFNGSAVTAASGRPEVNTTYFNGTAATASGGRPEVNTTHAAGTAWNSGAIGASTLAADTITAAKIAADAIGASELAADAVTEIQSGLATSANQSTIIGYIDTEVAAILAAVDTEVAAIKAKTDNLPAAPAATGDIPTAGAVADAVWDEATAGHTTSGTFGEQLKTDVDAILADTDVIGVTGAGLTSLATQASVNTLDDFVDTEVAAIKAVTDALGATAAGRLQTAVLTEQTGTIDTAAFSPTTTEFEADDITEATADHYNGRVILFTSGALQYQATSISDYALSGGRGHFTVPALTEAPANNDTFIIV